MSTFTALNGGSPSHPEAPSITVDTSAMEDGQRTSPPPRPQPAEGAGSRRESFERPSMQTTGHAGTGDGSLKRKYSESHEGGAKRALQQERTPDAETKPHVDHRDVLGTPKRDQQHQNQQQMSPRSRGRDSWYSSRGREERTPHESRQGSVASPRHEAEGHAGEPLPPRAASHDDHGDYANSSPEPDDRSVSYYGGQYSSDRQGSMLQHDPKKRKRNFSNRTKTGCLTCRKRKKKCDESKPECKSTRLDVSGSLRDVGPRGADFLVQARTV